MAVAALILILFSIGILYRYGEKFFEKLPIRHRVESQMIYLDPGHQGRRVKKSYWKEKVWTAVLVFLICTMLGILQEIGNLNQKEKMDSLSRPMPGEGTKEEYFYVGREDTKELSEVHLRVSERSADEEEAERCFYEAYEYLSHMFEDMEELSEQESQHIELPERLENGVKISWFSDDNEKINPDGNMNTKDLEEKTQVKLTAWMEYGKFEQKKEFYLLLSPYAGERTFLEKVERALKKQNEQGEKQKQIFLPEQIDGISIWYQREAETGIGVFILFGVVAACSVFFLKDQKIKTEYEKKQDILEQTYPEIVMKMMLLIKGGMTIRGAWERIVEVYQKTGKKHYAYEEMEITMYQIQQGKSERDAYREFGRRCQLSVYRKLASLLEQNLSKGSSGLMQLLEAEVHEALEERKNQAVRRGEEAATKLLVPMFLMLGVVMIICIAPAFLSFQGI